MPPTRTTDRSLQGRSEKRGGDQDRDDTPEEAGFNEAHGSLAVCLQEMQRSKLIEQGPQRLDQMLASARRLRHRPGGLLARPMRHDPVEKVARLGALLAGIQAGEQKVPGLSP